MEYDPIKRSLGNVFNKNPFLRKTFYRLLDLLLLRAWHVHLELRKWMQVSPQNASILDAGAGFGKDTNAVTIIDSLGEEFEIPLSSKKEVADKIVQIIIQKIHA